MNPISRREILRRGSIGIGLISAGCISPKQSEETASSTKTMETALPAESCDGYTPIDPWWAVRGQGPLAGFSLDLSSANVSIGKQIRATLTNVSGNNRKTGSKMEYDIQYRDNDKWRSIFGVEQKSVVYTDELVEHQPGGGFEWVFEFSQSGLSNSISKQPTYYVCHELQEGEYRFVYWGIHPEEEKEDESRIQYAIAKPFVVE